MKNTHAGLHKNIDKAETLLKLMANSARLLVLCHLADGEKNVTDLVKAIKLSQPAVSQHLARMRYEGLVTARKKGQSVFYKIARPEVMQLVSAVEKIFAKPEKVETKSKAKETKPQKAEWPSQMSFLK
jgi:DNA-binding transcriptional ArsR family regulator